MGQRPPGWNRVGFRRGGQGIQTATTLITNVKELQISAYADSLMAWTNPYQVFDDDIVVGASGRWTANNIGSGTETRGVRSCTIFTSNATANNLGGAVYGANMGGGGFPLFFPNGTLSKFYAEVRMRATTAIDNVTEINLGDSVEWNIGIRGASTTGFYIARFSNGPTTLTSTVPIDTSMHVFRCWRDGLTTFFGLDGENWQSSAAAFATNQERIILRAFNAATAASRAMEVDYVFLRGERP